MRSFARNSFNVDVVPGFQDRPLFSTRGTVRSNRTMWISGPITTVHDEHICHVMAAVARVGLETVGLETVDLETVGLEIERGLSEKCRSAAGVLGIHPICVNRSLSR